MIYFGLVSDSSCSSSYQTLTWLEEMVSLVSKLFQVLKMKWHLQTNSKPKKIQDSHYSLGFKTTSAKSYGTSQNTKAATKEILDQQKMVPSHEKITPPQNTVHPQLLLAPHTIKTESLLWRTRGGMLKNAIIDRFTVEEGSKNPGIGWSTVYTTTFLLFLVFWHISEFSHSFPKLTVFS